jgi:hypothetical protein
MEVISQGPDATIGRKASSSSSSTAAHTQDTQKSLSVKRSRDSMEGAEAEDEEDRVEDDQPALKKMEMGDFVAMPDVEDGE